MTEREAIAELKRRAYRNKVLEHEENLVAIQALEKQAATSSELKAYRANAAERKEVKIWNRRENDKIDSQSTTYDVDKVVEELNEIICPKRLYFCRVSKAECNKPDDVGCIDCAIQKAIEIVKRGGKNE